MARGTDGAQRARGPMKQGVPSASVVVEEHAADGALSMCIALSVLASQRRCRISLVIERNDASRVSRVTEHHLCGPEMSAQ